MIFFDYLTLKVIWWLFVGVLLIGFALLDGFDLGVGTLLPFVAKTDTERRVLINTIGPTWEGNQVWFITAGGAIFAAWPMVYATAFSGFYWDSTTEVKSPIPAGETPGTGACSLAGPFRHWCSAWLSEIYSRGFPFTTTN